jgi:hypothetical protein
MHAIVARAGDLRTSHGITVSSHLHAWNKDTQKDNGALNCRLPPFPDMKKGPQRRAAMRRCMETLVWRHEFMCKIRGQIIMIFDGIVMIFDRGIGEKNLRHLNLNLFPTTMPPPPPPVLWLGWTTISHLKHYHVWILLSDPSTQPEASKTPVAGPMQRALYWHPPCDMHGISISSPSPLLQKGNKHICPLHHHWV